MGRGAGPRAGLVRLALAGEVQGGRLHVLPCADEIGEHEKPRGSHRMMPSTGVKITTIIS
ncbi:hypothetical protein BK373_26665 [Escherichia coli]|nr:hypothetical protein BK373_26665 [Escherichia coli]GAR13798.1 hypothetical protein NGUA04_04427 [Salmonella enterica]